jgi:hypothetical protein
MSARVVRTKLPPLDALVQAGTGAFAAEPMEPQDPNAMWEVTVSITMASDTGRKEKRATNLNIAKTARL